MSIVTLLVYLAIFVIAIGIIYFLLSKLTIEEPIRTWIHIAIVVIAGIVLIMVLLSLIGEGPSLRMR